MVITELKQQAAFAYLSTATQQSAAHWCDLVPEGYDIFGYEEVRKADRVIDLFIRRITIPTPVEATYQKTTDFAPHRVPLIARPHVEGSWELERFRGSVVRIGHPDLRLVNPASFSNKMIQFTIPAELRNFQKFEQFEVIVRLHPVESARPRTSTGALETMPARHGQLWEGWEKAVVKRMTARGRSDEEIAEAIDRVPNAVFCYRQKNGIRSLVSSNEGVH